MKRIPEPELMEEREQAEAYAAADFEDAHSRFVVAFREIFGNVSGYVLDLGCGPGDITCRFARAQPACVVHGVDGSEAMIRCGLDLLDRDAALEGRVELIQGLLPGASLPRPAYDAVISNSLLHHLHDPGVLWRTVSEVAAPGAPVFIMDLRRPASSEAARELVETYSGEEPEVLQRDFYNSLLAAFEPGEIRQQLEDAGLSHFEIREISDRHVVVSGRR